MVRTRSSARLGGSTISHAAEGEAAPPAAPPTPPPVTTRPEKPHKNKKDKQSKSHSKNKNPSSLDWRVAEVPPLSSINTGMAGLGGRGLEAGAGIPPTAVVPSYSMGSTTSGYMTQRPPAPSLYERQVLQVPPRMYGMQCLYGDVGKQVSGGSYPVHPDVRFRRLPFYQLLAEVLKPSTLAPSSACRLQESTFYFHLTPQQASDIMNGPDTNTIQVQLRFCLLETSCEQDDCFPPSCSVKVNNRICQLPMPIPTNKTGVEPKRPPGPVNITTLLKLSPTVANTVSVTWAADVVSRYATCVSLVRKLTSAQLLNRLRSKGTKHSDFTRSLIKEKLREDLDCEIATTSLRVSLVCPLGKMRMTNPCRPATCLHLQCFDASLFLQMNERKPTWLCPVCDKPALYDVLVVDGYFQDVLNSPRLSAECNEIQLHKDGSWSAHLKKETIAEDFFNETNNSSVQVISDDLDVIPLSDSSESNSSGPPRAKRAAVSSERQPDQPTPAPCPWGGGASSQSNTVDLTSDSEDDLPLKRKQPSEGPAYPSLHMLAEVCTDASSDDMYSGANSQRTIAMAVSSIISLDSPSPPASPAHPASPSSLPSMPSPQLSSPSPPASPPKDPSPLPSPLPSPQQRVSPPAPETTPSPFYSIMLDLLKPPQAIVAPFQPEPDPLPAEPQAEHFSAQPSDNDETQEATVDMTMSPLNQVNQVEQSDVVSEK